MADKRIATKVEVSLRDVEPVKSFIGAVTDIRNDKDMPASIKGKIDAACKALYSGFGNSGSINKDLAEWRGWKINPEDVPHPEREKWPRVCIVIPVFNSPELLKQCLISLMRTDYPGQVAYIAVDNASTDEQTLAILAQQPFTPVRFDEPVGFSAAVNAGMKAAPGFDYYVLFNQDCRVIEEQWLANLINWMELRPQCAVTGAKLLYPDGRVQHAGLEVKKGGTGHHPNIGCSPDLPEVNFYEKKQAVTGAVYAIRGTVLDDIGYLDENYELGCEDTEFCLRAGAAGYEVWYVPECVVTHHDNGVRKTNPQDSERIVSWAKESCRVFRMEWGVFADRCASESVAFVLPDMNFAAGGCRVVAALANSFINAGIETAIYTYNGRITNEDASFPRLFQVKPLSALHNADTLIATRFDTVARTQNIPAKRKFYLVQQIETPMAKYCGYKEEDVLWSYRQQDYEIITIGEHLAKQLADMGRSCKILDVGLYTELYSFVPRELNPDRPFKVLMYASNADYKGAGDLPRIAEALRNKIGRQVEISSFHRDFAKPSWADHHYQPKNTKEVAEVYAAHDCYVYASLSDGFAMTPVEAMVCGTPVVMTDFPGKDQYARNGYNCYIVDYRDACTIANVVSIIAKSPGLWAELSIFGRKTAEQYDWKLVGRQYIREIMGAPK